MRQPLPEQLQSDSVSGGLVSAIAVKRPGTEFKMFIRRQYPWANAGILTLAPAITCRADTAVGIPVAADKTALPSRLPK